MKVYIADFYRLNKEHLIYNQSMIEIFCALTFVEAVYAFGHQTQIELFREDKNFSASGKLVLTPVYVHQKLGGRHWFKKIFHELKNAVNLLNVAGRESGSLVFFSSLSPIASFFLKSVKKFYPNQKMIISLHGDLDFIQKNKSRMRNILGSFFIKSFKIKDRNTKYLVLSEVIEKNLLATGLLNKDEIYTIDHPYRFDENISSRAIHKDCIYIGHIGTASEEKNTQLIFELASRLKDEIQLGKVSFSVIGQSVNIDNYKNEWVNFTPTKSMLSKAEFHSEISKLDYTIFFYKDLNHKYSSSGAILDSINHLVPIISLDNEVFSYTFLRASGPIGFLCKDLDEMEVLVRKLLKREDPHQYPYMVDNLKKYQSFYSLDFISDQLQKQILNFLYA